MHEDRADTDGASLIAGLAGDGYRVATTDYSNQGYDRGLHRSNQKSQFTKLPTTIAKC